MIANLRSKLARPVFSLSQKALLLIAVPLFFQLGFVIALHSLIDQVDTERTRQAHAREASLMLNNVFRLLLQDAMAQLIYQVTGIDQYKTKANALDAKFRNEANVLRQFVVGNSHEHDIITRAFIMCTTTSSSVEAVSMGLKSKDKALKAESYLRFKPLLHTTLGLTKQFVEELQPEAQRREASLIRLRALIESLLWFSVLFNIIAAILLALYFNRTTTRRMAILMDNTVLIAQGKPLNDPLAGQDEMAQLDDMMRKASSALFESRRKEQAVTENTRDVICSLKEDGTFISVNRASLVCFGWSPDELFGRSLISLAHRDDAAAVRAAIDEAVKGTLPGSFENRIVCKDGSVVEFLWTVSWSLADRALFLVGHDITERKRIDRLRREFVAMVSNGLQAPLNSLQEFLIQVSSQTLGPLPEAGQTAADFAKDTVGRLITLVNDLLQIEEMESGTLQLRLSESSVAAIIDRSIHSVSGFANQLGVVLKAPEKLSISVVADSDRLVQVLVNLLSNAIKFSARASTVTISVEEAGECVKVDVTDEGRGVPPKMRETIFERFQQVEEGDERKKGGSGLGLAICKAIVEAHGGSIGVEDAFPEGRAGEPAGSRFWFTVPNKIEPPSQ